MILSRSYCVLVVAFALICAACCQNSTLYTETFSTWDAAELAKLQLNSDAYQMNMNASSYDPDLLQGRLGLCRNQTWEAGSAFLKSTISLANNASFSTAFAFQITDPGGIGDEDGVGADGIVFIINARTNILGAAGIGIGYENIPTSVGVEFDTFNNQLPIDGSGNHVGIDINGDLVSKVSQHYPARMNDGEVYYVWVDFDGAVDSLQVRIGTSNVRPATPFLNYTVDLASVLQSTDVYVGFSSATGAAYGNHYLVSWSFNNYYQPIVKQNLPITSSVITSGSPVTTAEKKVSTSAALTTHHLTTQPLTTHALSTGAVPLVIAPIVAPAVTSKTSSPTAVIAGAAAALAAVLIAGALAVFFTIKNKKRMAALFSNFNNSTNVGSNPLYQARGGSGESALYRG